MSHATPMRPVVVVMAKEPVAGRAKTRLSPRLSPLDAARLSSALLDDTISLVSRLRHVHLALAITPGSAVETWGRTLDGEALLLGIDGRDIGECLCEATGRLFGSGFSPVLALNADSPHLPAARLDRAFACLEDTDVVIGPSDDGGYYLVGLRRPCPGLFSGIAWSSAHVREQTLARADALNCSTALLESVEPRRHPGRSRPTRSRPGSPARPCAPLDAARPRLRRWHREAWCPHGPARWSGPRLTTDGDRPMSGCLTRFGGLAAGREEEQKRYFAERRLYTLQIESTDACPQGCVYCYAGSSLAETRSLTGDEIRALLGAAARLEVRAIDWLGGDPLARPDWFPLMDCARSLGLTNNVWTSGIPLRDERTARMVTDVTAGGFVSVHVDSLVPDIYARLHPAGSPANIGAVVEGVDNLLRAGKPADQMINCITFTALQPAQDVIDTMRWWWREKGMRTCLTMFNPAGMGPDGLRFAPSAEDTRWVFNERDSLNYGDHDGSLAAMDTDKFYCGTMATVTFSGDVTPMLGDPRGRAPISGSRGSRRSSRSTSVTLVHEQLHDARQAPAPCSQCRENEHCWGCRASAYHYGGDANGIDPKCWMMNPVTDTGLLTLGRPTSKGDAQ